MKGDNRQKAGFKSLPECTSLTEFISDSGASDSVRLPEALQKHAVNPSVEALRATSMLPKVSEGPPADRLAMVVLARSTKGVPFRFEAITHDGILNNATSGFASSNFWNANIPPFNSI